MSEINKDTPEPRWGTVNSLFDEIDKILDEYITKKDCNFLEIEVALLMVREKISENKMAIMLHLQGGEHKDEPSNDSMYK